VNQPELALEKLRQAATMETTAHVYSQIAMVYGSAAAGPKRWMPWHSPKDSIRTSPLPICTKATFIFL